MPALAVPYPAPRSTVRARQGGSEGRQARYKRSLEVARRE
jgi:hypothetical protein